ncbi:MAG: hypothetical protein FWF94_04175 [Oscillospiraceae bacterium]|nr:hypothetical protein [Oscillospiraceae bacterium]
MEADGVDVNTTFYKFDVESDESFAQPSVSYDTDRTFQANLKDIGLSVQNKNKMFTFIHFAGVHDSGEIGYYGRAKEALDILDDYFSQMKKLNIYDKSTIIIVADHGNPSYDIEYELTIFLEKEITSALLIKTKDARGEMKRDSVSELSHENFPASILEFAGLPHEKYGLSYFDIINGGLSPTRTIKINRWYTAGRIELASIYEVNGDANEFDNWEYLPIIPQSNNP